MSEDLCLNWRATELWRQCRIFCVSFSMGLSERQQRLFWEKMRNTTTKKYLANWSSLQAHAETHCHNIFVIGSTFFFHFAYGLRETCRQKKWKKRTEKETKTRCICCGQNRAAKNLINKKNILKNIWLTFNSNCEWEKKQYNITHVSSEFYFGNTGNSNVFFCLSAACNV